MTTPTRPLLRYHGGKWTQRRHILAYMQTPHTVFLSWFAGGGSVEMMKPRVHTEVWNDRWGLVVNLYRVLRNRSQAAELERLLRLTPYARDEWNYVNSLDWSTVTDPVELARLMIFRSFSGYGSGSTNPNYSTGFRGSSSRSGFGPSRDWQNYPDQISRFTDRLQGITFENLHYRNLPDKHDTLHTLHYADPPYMLGTRNSNGEVYAYEMTDADHAEFLTMALRMNGQMIISAYETDLYNDLLTDWTKVQYGAIADGGRDRTETLYINPYCASLQRKRVRQASLKF